MTDPRAFLRCAAVKNGLAVTIRHLRPDDRARIAGARRQLDRQSVYTRLFSYRGELTGCGRYLASGAEGDVMAENAPMPAVIDRSGLPLRKTREADILHLMLSL